MIFVVVKVSDYARENLKSRIDIWTSPDFKFSIEKKKFGRVRNSNLDKSGFEIFNQKFQIWTSPDLNLDKSRFEIFN